MLVLSRSNNQDICFPDIGIRVEVLEIAGSKVKIGVDAPQDVQILRGELLDRRSTRQPETDVIDVQSLLRKCTATLRACAAVDHEEIEDTDVAVLLDEMATAMKQMRRQILANRPRKTKRAGETPPRKIAPSKVQVTKATLTA